jgi:hypothetical protein
MDWVAWHADYEDADSPLRRRLAIVQREIGSFIADFSGSPVRVVSMCAGEARDLLGAVAVSDRRDLVGRLVELNPELTDVARRGCVTLGLGDVEVVTGDAGHSSAYRDAVPADLVLECGVFGNISDADVERTVRATPQLCAAGATVIWTRHRRDPDLTPAIRRWYAESGFEERSFEPVPDSEASVGVMVYRGGPVPLFDQQLFVFNRNA